MSRREPRRPRQKKAQKRTWETMGEPTVVARSEVTAAEIHTELMRQRWLRQTEREGMWTTLLPADLARAVATLLTAQEQATLLGVGIRAGEPTLPPPTGTAIPLWILTALRQSPCYVRAALLLQDVNGEDVYFSVAHSWDRTWQIRDATRDMAIFQPNEDAVAEAFITRYVASHRLSNIEEFELACELPYYSVTWGRAGLRGFEPWIKNADAPHGTTPTASEWSSPRFHEMLTQMVSFFAPYRRFDVPTDDADIKPWKQLAAQISTAMVHSV